MFYFLLDFAYYRQLRRIDADRLARLVDEVNAVVSARGGRETSAVSGSYFFELGAAAAEDGRRAVDTVLAVDNLLKLRSEDLAGFTAWLEVATGGESEAEVFARSRLAANRVLEEDAVHASLGATELLAPFASFCGESEPFRLVGRKERLGSAARDIRNFAAEAEEAGPLADELALGTQAFGILFRHRLPDARYLLSAALAAVYGSRPVLWFYPLRGGPLSSLRSAVDGAVAAGVAEHLTSAERAIWDLVRPVIEGRSDLCDAPVPDLYSGLSIYVRGFVRYCEELLMQPILVCEDPGRWTATERRVLKAVMDEHTGTPDLLPIFLIAETTLPEEFSGLDLKPIDAEPRGLPLVRRFYREGLGRGESEQPLGALTEMGEAGTEVVYAAGLVSNPGEVLPSFFEMRGMNRARFNHVAEELVGLGFLRDEAGLEPVHADLHLEVEQRMGSRAEELRLGLSRHLFLGWSKRPRPAGRPLFDAMACLGGLDEFIPVYVSFVQALIVGGELEGAHALLYGADYPARPAQTRAECEWWEAARVSLRLHLAIAVGEFHEIRSAAEGLAAVEPSETSPAYPLWLVQKARYANIVRDSRSARNLAKSAVIFFQQAGDEKGLAEANVELGLAAAGAGRLDEAKDYFGIAFDAAIHGGLPFEQLRSGLFVQTVHYLTGNYSRVLDGIDRILDLAADLGLHRWTILILFLRARVHFELGLYEEAEAGFEVVLAHCRASGHGAPMPVAYAWIGRCLVHRGAIADGVRLLQQLEPSAENQYFVAEAKALAGAYDEAVVFIDTSAVYDSVPEAFLGIAVGWKDGFFWENIGAGSVAGESLFHRQRKIFRDYCEAKAGAGALEEMRSHIREERGPDHDAGNRLYYFWFSEIIPHDRTDDIEDRVTLLGKAVKYLQERNSRIDEPSHKAAFLYKNLWNHLLVTEARKHYLI